MARSFGRLPSGVPFDRSPAVKGLRDSRKTMKNLKFAACLLVALVLASATSPSTVSAQVKSVAAASKQPASNSTDRGPANGTTGTRARVTQVPPDVKAVPQSGKNGGDRNLQAHAKSGSSPSNGLIRTTTSTTMDSGSNLTANRARTVSIPPATVALKPAGNNSSPLPTNSNAGLPTPVIAAPGQIYRVGVRDVLDIQLAGISAKQSTLFTVFDGGLLEYPLAGGPIPVAGMTTAEIAALLRQRIRTLDNPAVVVKVRDYASHPVTVTGFVAAPGVKNLRREAVPLYTMLAEALMLPEAAQATITRQGRAPILVDLKDSTLASTLVLPGDAIKVSGMAAATEFLFVGGEIGSPGQKPYHAGLTLTQAILASGGTTKSAGSKVRVSRQGADGRLRTEEYNLRKIQDGKNPDPVLQKGDRIQVDTAR